MTLICGAFLHCSAKNSSVWFEGQSSWTAGDPQASPFKAALQLPLVDMFPQADWVLFFCFIQYLVLLLKVLMGSFFFFTSFSDYQVGKINNPLKPGIYFLFQWLWVHLCYSSQNVEWVILFSLSFLLINSVGWKCKECKNCTEYTNTHTRTLTHPGQEEI